ncbi:MAG: MBL fold metallo-hydrolase, partial [Thermofilaceae archaeon]
MTQIAILGSAGSAPWAHKNLPSVFIDGTLFDCGEGVTRALAELDLLDKVERVFLTHMHMDHVSGLPTLLQLYALSGIKDEVSIIVPLSCKDKLLTFLNSLHVAGKLKLNIYEIHADESLGSVKACKALHSTEALAYKIFASNEKIVYTGDTAPCSEVLELSRGCSVIIHESTLPPEKEELVKVLGHSTPRDAGRVAEDAGAKTLVLFHLPYFYYRGPGFLEKFIKVAASEFTGNIV